MAGFVAFLTSRRLTTLDTTDALIRTRIATGSFRSNGCRSRLGTLSRTNLPKEKTSTATETAASNITAPTRFLDAGKERYAYRRFGAGQALPLLCLQHFTGNIDNWTQRLPTPLHPDGK